MESGRKVVRNRPTMQATLKEALQQRKDKEDGSREVERDKRVLGIVLLVSVAHRVVEMGTYGKPEFGGKWDNIPELLDPHCDKSLKNELKGD